MPIEKLDVFFSTKMNKELSKKLCIIGFLEIRQKDEESIAEFASRLRRAAVPCEFGDTAEEEIMIQLFRGTKDQTVRKEVLAATDKDSVDDILGRVRAIALIASSIRATEKTPVVNHESINAFGKSLRKSKSKSSRKCFNCGGRYPHQGHCPATSKTCNECGERDHFARCCPKRKREKHVSTVQPREEDGFLFMVKVTKDDNVPIAEITVNCTKIPMFVNSGASETVIDEATLSLLKPEPKLMAPKSKLYRFEETEGRHEVEQLGQFEASLEANGHGILDTVRVVPGKAGCVLSHRAAVYLDMYKTPLFRRVENFETVNENKLLF